MGEELRISLFGTLNIRSYGQRVIDIEARRAQELLAYLLLFRDRLHEREKLATTMWGDKSAARSRRYFRQALWQVQSALQVAGSCGGVLLVDHHRIGINPRAVIWLDVVVLSEAFARVERIPGGTLEPEQVQVIEDALPLYKGDLLEGWYADWCTIERERYQTMYLAMLDKLLNYCIVHHEYGAGLDYGARILHFDRARERTHRSLMRLHYLAGYRNAAIQQYITCVAVLEEELGVGPSKSTVALYQQICADQVAVQDSLALQLSSLARAKGSLLQVAQPELEEIRVSLVQLQVQFAELIEKLAAGFYS